jgi:hypothetical protein
MLKLEEARSQEAAAQIGSLEGEGAAGIAVDTKEKEELLQLHTRMMELRAEAEEMQLTLKVIASCPELRAKYPSCVQFLFAHHLVSLLRSRRALEQVQLPSKQKGVDLPED